MPLIKDNGLIHSFYPLSINNNELNSFLATLRHLGDSFNTVNAFNYITVADLLHITWEMSLLKNQIV